MKVEMKYALEPVSVEYKNVQLLYGYAVSKCYHIRGLKGNVVLFPYTLKKSCVHLNNYNKRKEAIIGFNTNYVDKVYETYNSAKQDCDVKNKEIMSKKDESEIREFISNIHRIQKLILSKTQSLCINEKECIKIKKLKG